MGMNNGYTTCKACLKATGHCDASTDRSQCHTYHMTHNVNDKNKVNDMNSSYLLKNILKRLIAIENKLLFINKEKGII